MARIYIPFIVEKQQLTQAPAMELHTGSQDTFYATFVIDDSWANVPVIKAIFTRAGVSTPVELTKNGTVYDCEIPWKMSSTVGEFSVSIYDGDRTSTNSVTLIVGENESEAQSMSTFSLRRVETTSTFVIDGDTRVITPPANFLNLGVESDKNSNRVYFEVPQIVGDGIDLSELNLYINFRNANGETDKYRVEDAEAVDGMLYFSWSIGGNVTRYKGTVSFIVCAVRTDVDGKIETEWNTTLCSGEILEGIEVDGLAPDGDSYDIVNQLIEMIGKIDVALDEIISLQDQYIEGAIL